jgi:hypothetical protein
MGTVAVLVVAGVVLVLVHLVGGLFHHTRSRRRGHRVNIGWSMSRGWWGSTRVGGGTYYRHF